ncbi:MAG: 2-C-methyl-D-erythritol 4-phosphate cytidylyltransferase [Gammaproteobacteria bacterium]|nr:2-C-methyl-D-erythritol 4-phosphate cytidylyltransferase [Gammaproteobacteria bacterium]
MTDPAMNCWGILPAAGSGSRFGAEVPKQYLPVNGRPVISWSIETLLAAPLEALIVALGPGDTHWPALGWDGKPRIETCAGGAQRQQSVLNALAALQGRAGEDDWILVHDAVRPCVRAEDIARLIESTDSGGKDGGMLGWPVDNSLKRVASSMAVLDNVDRRECWNAATPQMFRHGVLLAALRQAEEEGVSHTDESAAVMAAGGSVLMVSCAKDNIKITHEPDLALAGFILERQRENSP